MEKKSPLSVTQGVKIIVDKPNDYSLNLIEKVKYCGSNIPKLSSFEKCKVYRN